MRKSSLTVAAIVIISTLFIGLTLLPDVRATTLYVGGAGPGNYTAIQTAVDDANPGDTVYVYSGTYRETTIINKTVSLVGEDQTVTVVDGNGTADVIHVSSDWVNVTGFTIMNGGRFTGNSGIELQSVQHCHIASNTLLNNSFGIRLLSSANNSIAQNSAFNSSNGIRLESSSNNTIINNNASLNQFIGIYLIESNDNSVIENTAFGNIGPGIAVEESINNIIEANNALHNDHGIRLSRSSDNLVANNTLSSNIFTGIRVYSSSDVTIQNNTIVNDPTVTERFLGVESYNSNSLTITGNVMVKSGIFIRGMTVWEWNTHSIGTSNTVNGKPVHYWKDAVGGTVPAGAGQVILANCVNVVVTGQNTSDGSVGIQLGFSSDNTISDNEASSNSYAGIYARETTRNVFDNNTLLSNGMEGIYLLDAKMSMITNNTVNYNSRGIQLSGSSNNTVTDNTASLNEGSGILLASSRENSLVGNTVSSNNYTGIVVHTSENNTFTRNTVSGNVRGIDLYYSIGDIFVNNTLVGNGFYLQGDSVEYWNSHDIESTNTVNGRPVYYWKDALGGTVPSGAGQVLLANCNGTAVENQNLSIASVGIEIGFSSHVTIFNVTASANTEGGISLYSSVDVAILNSTTTSNDAVGILLVSSVGITLSSNRMTGDGILLHGDLLQHWNTHTFNRSNRLNGKMVAYAKNLVGPEILPPIGQLILANCSQMTAKYLNLSDASAGIQMGFSSNNTILGNMISSNRWFGIRLYSSNDNVIVGNTISQTPWLGMSLISSSGNLIYHNNFIDNTMQAWDDTSIMPGNSWSNGLPDGGNHWSDYAGVDIFPAPNGIGDSSYSILGAGAAKDSYPWMREDGWRLPYSKFISVAWDEFNGQFWLTCEDSADATSTIYYVQSGTPTTMIPIPAPAITFTAIAADNLGNVLIGGNDLDAMYYYDGVDGHEVTEIGTGKMWGWNITSISFNPNDDRFYIVGNIMNQDKGVAFFTDEVPLNSGSAKCYKDSSSFMNSPGPAGLKAIAWNPTMDYGLAVGDGVYRLDPYDGNPGYELYWTEIGAPTAGTQYSDVSWDTDGWNEAGICGDDNTNGAYWRYYHSNPQLQNGYTNGIGGTEYTTCAMKPPSSPKWLLVVGPSGGLQVNIEELDQSTDLSASYSLVDPNIYWVGFNDTGMASLNNQMANPDSWFNIAFEYNYSGGWDQVRADITFWYDDGWTGTNSLYPAENEVNRNKAFNLTYEPLAAQQYKINYPIAPELETTIGVVSDTVILVHPTDIAQSVHRVVLQVRLGAQSHAADGNGFAPAGPDSHSDPNIAFDNPNSWDFNVTLVDVGDDTKTNSTYGEFGIKQAVSISISGNPSGEAAPGAFGIYLGASTIEYSTNTQYWVNVSIPHLYLDGDVGNPAYIPADNMRLYNANNLASLPWASDIAGATYLAADVPVCVWGHSTMGTLSPPSNGTTAHGPWGSNYNNYENPGGTTSVNWYVDMPAAVLAGTYQATISYSIETSG
ncbi:MAG: right-handed parallel beta-helix repeat-containing protein [Thermoplasmata archaeon]|nr:right-handed parallel beta-helix repeat-containing protein [Thermoplasmata archaeon]